MDNQLREQCMALRRKGHTLSEICTITGHKKTTVYYHIKDVALPNNRQLLVRGGALSDFVCMLKHMCEVGQGTIVTLQLSQRGRVTWCLWSPTSSLTAMSLRALVLTTTEVKR